MKKRIAALFLAAAMGLSLMACSQNPSGSSPAPGSSSAPSETGGTENTFPEGPITLVCPWGAGAGADTICRMFERLGQKYFGVPIVVENQEGAAGVTATIQFISSAKPDGYSVIFNNGGVFTAKSLTGNSDYSIDDFRPICGIVKEANVLIVNSKLGVSNFDEFLEKYSGSGEKITYGCATAGIPQMCIESLFTEADINGTQVAYNGASEITTALLGGHVDLICVGVSEIGPLLDNDSANILAVFSDEVPDVEGLDGVPTVQSYGFENTDFYVWRIMLAPKDTPDDVFQVLQEGFTGMINDPEFVEFAENSGLLIDLKSSEEVTQGVKDELEMMIPIFQELKLGIYAE